MTHPRPTVAFLSTFPPHKCAIGVYARHLARAVVAEPGAPRLVVLSEGGQAAPGDEGLEVEDTYHRDRDFAAALGARLEALAPDVVHAQHAPDMFPDNDRFVALLTQAADRGARVLLTLHTVYDTPAWQRVFAALDGRVHFIVHNDLCEATLRKVVQASEIFVIPHGTDFPPTPDQGAARRHLGIEPHDFVFLFFGAIHGGKNLHTAVRAFRKVARGLPRARMVVAGRPWDDRWYNHLYVACTKVLGGGSSRFTWRTTYVADEDVPRYIASADVLLLPYKQQYNSSSGVFHLAMAAPRPVICSDSPKFAEIKADLSDPGDAAAVFVPTTDVGAWSKAMLRMALDEELRTRIRDVLHAYGRRTAWDVVARQHLAAYGLAPP